jgi:hypothetical protein
MAGGVLAQRPAALVGRSVPAAHSAAMERPVPAARSASRRPVRLTRRGRTVLVLLLLVVIGVLAAVLAPASRAADPAGPAEIAVVQPGDTLWSVAERHAPSRNPFGVIEQIRTLNDLDGYTVHAGQELLLPRHAD